MSDNSLFGLQMLLLLAEMFPQRVTMVLEWSISGVGFAVSCHVQVASPVQLVHFTPGDGNYGEGKGNPAANEAASLVLLSGIIRSANGSCRSESHLTELEKLPRQLLP